MPILDLDTRFRELGRLRLGEDLGDRPSALDVWRLTSPHEDLLVAAADIYGGDVDVWHDGFELTTTAGELEVLVPFQDVAAGQWLELWRGSTLARRCDGRNVVEYVDGQLQTLTSCECDAASRECKPTTHLRVVLPQLPDLGVWRLVTRSVYAAIELPGAVDLLLRTHGGDLAPAVLALEKRRGSQRRPYIVPVLRTTSTLNQLVGEAGRAPYGHLSAATEPAGRTPPKAGDLAPATPSRPAELGNPSEAPRSPQNDANAPPSPPPHEWPKKDVWRRLGGLLRDNPPSELTSTTGEELVTLLTELEDLMLEVNLWSPTVAGVSPLDSAAARRDLDRWREVGAYFTDKLRAFAQRSLMAAANDFRNHRNGDIIIRELELEEVPR